MYFQQYFPSFPAKFLTFAPLLQKVALSKKPNKQIGQEAESWKNRTGGVIIPEKTQWHSVMTLRRCQHPLNVSRIMVSPTRGLVPNATSYLSYFRPHLLRGLPHTDWHCGRVGARPDGRCKLVPAPHHPGFAPRSEDWKARTLT